MGWLFMVILVIAVVAALVWGGSTAGRALWARGGQDDKQRSAPRSPSRHGAEVVDLVGIALAERGIGRRVGHEPKACGGGPSRVPHR